MREAASRRRVSAIVLSVFAGAAVLQAAIGLYDVIAQSVTERRKESGVRMALGATDDARNGDGTVDSCCVARLLLPGAVRHPRPSIGRAAMGVTEIVAAPGTSSYTVTHVSTLARLMPRQHSSGRAQT